MPRQKRYSEDDLMGAAMRQFWGHGFTATSMDHLVSVTGVSRHGIYSAFGGKRDLFLACLEVYQQVVVTPAFAMVEEKGAGLSAIAGYFETQIAKAEALGLPGPGCLVANTMTELGPHDRDVLDRVNRHNQRLHAGFKKALAAADKNEPPLSENVLSDLASLLVTSAQGLWSFSRSVDQAEPLRRIVATLLDLLKARLTP